MENNRDIKERYSAVLVGCGYGDTLGMAVEGWKEQQIKKYVGKVSKPIAPVLIRDSDGKLKTEDEFGKLKCYGKDLMVGDITDDTILTIPLAESIIEKKYIDVEDICKKQVEAYQSKKLPNGQIVGGFGKTTMDAFENMIKGFSYEKSGIFPGLGTGPCMKMSPVGIYMHATKKYNEGIEKARLIGAATHKDERAIASGIVQAHAIYTLLERDLTRNEFLESLVECCYKNEIENPKNFPRAEKGKLTEKLEWILQNKDVNDRIAKEELKNSSLAISAYPFTIFMFQKYWNNPIGGLIETVNYGGDCDTTGAMYGALCGAKNGMIFPDNWKLNEKKKLNELGKKLAEVNYA